MDCEGKSRGNCGLKRGPPEGREGTGGAGGGRFVWLDLIDRTERNAYAAKIDIPVRNAYLESRAYVCPAFLLQSASESSRLLTIAEIVCRLKKTQISNAVQERARNGSSVHGAENFSMNVALSPMTPAESVMSCFISSSAITCASGAAWAWLISTLHSSFRTGTPGLFRARSGT
jgi:hypothetical protein